MTSRDPDAILSDARACARAARSSTGETRRYWRMWLRSFRLELRGVLQSFDSRGEDPRQERVL